MSKQIEALPLTADEIETLRRMGDGRVFATASRIVATIDALALEAEECSGCTFERQTGGNHDDCPVTEGMQPDCRYRLKAEAEGLRRELMLTGSTLHHVMRHIGHPKICERDVCVRWQSFAQPLEARDD